MASNICQRLLNKVWRSYANDLHEAPQAKGIYAIGRTWGNDVRYIYVGHSNDIRRRLQEHKYQHLAIDEFVKEQFRLNNGQNLRIKWVEEKNGECVEGDYLDCMHQKLGYWPDYNKKHGANSSIYGICTDENLRQVQTRPNPQSSVKFLCFTSYPLA